MKIPDLKEIAISWMRAANPTPEQQLVAEERVAVCDTCPLKHYQRLTHMWVCGACGCPLNKKVYSPKLGPEACPKGNWVR